jgi:hypothetical protein
MLSRAHLSELAGTVRACAHWRRAGTSCIQYSRYFYSVVAIRPCGPSVLTLICPYCSTQLADDFECLAPNHLDTLGCENIRCAQRFAYLIRECLKCGEESVFSWKVMPKPPEMSGLSCQHCGADLNEADRET